VKFPKDKPARSRKYMDWIITQPCCLTGMLPNDIHGCDPHHVNGKGQGTMGGKPFDSRCIPIAHFLHCEMNQPGSSERAVFERFGVDAEEVVREMRERWIARGNKAFWETENE